MNAYGFVLLSSILAFHSPGPLGEFPAGEGSAFVDLGFPFALKDIIGTVKILIKFVDNTFKC